MLQLSKQEAELFRILSFARMKVLGAGDPSSPDVLPLHRKMSVSILRQTLPVFDFYRCVYDGNVGGLQRLVTAQQSMGPHVAKKEPAVDITVLIRQYQRIVGTAINPDDVLALQRRITDYIAP